MKKEGILLIVGIVLIIASFITAFTGHAARWTDSANPQYQGGHFGTPPERELRTTIEIFADEYDENGRPVFELGEAIHFKIIPGKEGIMGGEEESIKLRYAGSRLVKDRIRNVCSHYYCEEDNDACQRDSKRYRCYEPREISFQTYYYWKPGRYFITGCELMAYSFFNPSLVEPGGSMKSGVSAAGISGTTEGQHYGGQGGSDCREISSTEFILKETKPKRATTTHYQGQSSPNY